MRLRTADPDDRNRGWWPSAGERENGIRHAGELR
jgi:hypothetical protein